MKVIVFDEQHEDDLTNAINAWIEDNAPKICEIRFSTCAFALQQEQIYCFSALILYEEE